MLASGTGSLFQAILNSPIAGQTRALITDQPNCGAVEIARASNIPVRVVSLTDSVARDEWNDQMVSAVREFDPALIVSAGFMRILGPAFVNAFPDQIINTHPALLPEFPGAHAVRDAIQAGATRTGCTIHFIDHGVDTGPIVVQQSLEIEPGETLESLHERIKGIERELLPVTIAQLLVERTA